MCPHTPNPLSKQKAEEDSLIVQAEMHEHLLRAQQARIELFQLRFCRYKIPWSRLLPDRRRLAASGRGSISASQDSLILQEGGRHVEIACRLLEEPRAHAAASTAPACRRITIVARRLGPATVADADKRDHVPALAAVLQNCVVGGFQNLGDDSNGILFQRNS